MNNKSYVHIRLRRDTSSNWALNNPILKVGEPGLETDTRKLKFGDGETPWNNLHYSGGNIDQGLLLEDVDDRVATLVKAGSNISVSYDDNANTLTIGAVGLQLAGDYAVLVNGTVPAGQLPSYVDDVIEAANFASLPVSGESGKIYVTLDNNKTYRWSGSTYFEISASPGSTDAVPEGSVNKYYTDARASAAAPVQSVAGKTGNVLLDHNDIGAAAKWVVPTFVNNSFTASPNTTYYLADPGQSISLNTTPQTILDPPSANIGDYYVFINSGTKIVTVGGIEVRYGQAVIRIRIPNSSLLTPSQATWSTNRIGVDIQTATSFSTLPFFTTAPRPNNIIYITLDNNKLYRWNDGSNGYVELSASPSTTDALSEGSINKYYTDARASAAAPVQSVSGKTGVVTLSKNDVGLTNVDNTSDVNKSISSATQSALDTKAPIANPTFTGNINGQSFTATDATNSARTCFYSPDSLIMMNGTNIQFGVNPFGIVAVGKWMATTIEVAYGGTGATTATGARTNLELGNVDNTRDVNKPVSTAQAAADSAVQTYAVQRNNHTGTQAISTVDGLQTALNGKATVVSVPASATATGTSGQIAYDTSFLYVCVAANTWRRVSIAAW
jgi:hypothetical protein